MCHAIGKISVVEQHRDECLIAAHPDLASPDLSSYLQAAHGFAQDTILKLSDPRLVPIFPLSPCVLDAEEVWRPKRLLIGHTAHEKRRTTNLRI